MNKTEDASQEPIEAAWKFVEEFDEYCQGMTTGRLDGPPATELANIFEKAIQASRLQERDRIEEMLEIFIDTADFSAMNVESESEIIGYRHEEGVLRGVLAAIRARK